MIRLKDVADKAGVSIWTVSKVLNPAADRARISLACVRKVVKAANALGYSANYHARSLQTGRAHALGLLMGEATNVWVNPFWAHLLGGIEAEARRLGYDVVVIGPAGNQSDAERGINYIKTQRVDALIVPGHLSADFRNGRMESLDLPIVVAASRRKSRHWVVEVDPAPGVVEAVEYLASLGHKDLLWLEIDESRSPESIERRDAFEKAAGAAKIRTRQIAFNWSAEASSLDHVIRAARSRFLPLLKKPHSFTGVVCFNEAAALGVYAAAAELGLSIPRDLSVVGFDDLYAHVALPGMTVASHMLPEIGARAAELAVKLASGTKPLSYLPENGAENRLLRVPSKLVVRSSTAKPGNQNR